MSNKIKFVVHFSKNIIHILVLFVILIISLHPCYILINDMKCTSTFHDFAFYKVLNKIVNSENKLLKKC